MPTASEIIERVKARYAGCRSYEDTGSVVRVRVSGPHSWQRSTTFAKLTTRFIRPAHLYAECVQIGVGPEAEWERRVVTQNQRGISDWWTVTAPSKLPVDQDLEGAIYGLSQVCEASIITPFLLQSNLRMRHPLPKPQVCELRGNDVVDGHACHVVEAPRSLMILRLWVDQESLLVRRWESRDKYTNEDRTRIVAAMRVELAAPSVTRESRIALENAIANIEQSRPQSFTVTTTTWSPRMDHDIDPKVFEFTPPG